MGSLSADWPHDDTAQPIYSGTDRNLCGQPYLVGISRRAFYGTNPWHCPGLGRMWPPACQSVIDASGNLAGSVARRIGKDVSMASLGWHDSLCVAIGASLGTRCRCLAEFSTAGLANTFSIQSGLADKGRLAVAAAPDAWVGRHFHNAYSLSNLAFAPFRAGGRGTSRFCSPCLTWYQ